MGVEVLGKPSVSHLQTFHACVIPGFDEVLIRIIYFRPGKEGYQNNRKTDSNKNRCSFIAH
jgi:hypothetical protein